MIDLELIKKNYTNLLDSQLIELAQKDGYQITPEALGVLKDEFKKRKLDNSYIDAAEKKRQALQEEEELKANDKAEKKLRNEMWEYILKEKINGAADSTILQGIQSHGFDESRAKLIMSGFREKLRKMIANCSIQMIIGGLAFIIGTIITVVTLMAFHGEQYIVAYGAIIYGAIQFFSALSVKRKCKMVLDEIEENYLYN